MKTYLPVLGGCVALWLAGCASQPAPVTTEKLDPKIRAMIQQKRIEPGFTPEMVYLALGKPQSSTGELVDSASNGVWVYQDFAPGEKAFLAPGFSRRLVVDPKTNREVVTTERVKPELLAGLMPNSLKVTYQKGRVVEILRSGPI